MKIRRTMWLFLLLLLSGCGQRANMQQSLISWQKQPFMDVASCAKQLSEQRISRLYQYMPTEITQASWIELAQELTQYEIALYAVDGAPEWILEEDHTSCKEAIDQIYLQNAQKSGSAIQGIMLDVEPYGLAKWQEEQEALMDQYVTTIQVAYTHAQKYGIEVVLCIPYFFDDLGYDEELEALMPYCDEVAIMNYRKEQEWEHIAQEVQLAQQYEKPVSVIYELQAPGTHDLTSIHTYYEDGLAAVQNSFAALQKHESSLGIVYHEYQSYQSLWMEKGEEADVE